MAENKPEIIIIEDKLEIIEDKPDDKKSKAFYH